jgi:hypothetical protein
VKYARDIALRGVSGRLRHRQGVMVAELLPTALLAA